MEVEALASGDYRSGLESLRRLLAEQIEVASGDPRRLLHVAPIAARLESVMAKLEELPDAERKSTSDDLRARRAARRAAASGQ